MTASNGTTAHAQSIQVYVLNQDDHENQPDLTCYPQATGPVVPFADVAYAPAGRLFAVGKGGAIRASSDNSLSWQAVESGVNTDLLAVQFPSATTGYVVGKAGIVLKTIDAGSHWEVLPTGTANDFYALHFVDDRVGYLTGNLGMVLKTENGGASWTSLLTGATAAVRGISFPTRETGFISGAGGTVLKTVDGGKSWVPAGNTNLGEMYSLHFLTAETGLAAGLGGVSRTTDGGQTWQLTKITETDLLREVRLRSPQVGIAVGGQYHPEYWLTSDGGLSWRKQAFTEPAHYFSGVDFSADGTRGCLVGFGHDTYYGEGPYGQVIYTTGDGGTRWEQTGAMSREQLSGLTFVNSRVGYAYDPGATNELFKTIDGGQSWHRVKADTIPLRPARFIQDETSLRFLDENLGFALTDERLFRTTTGGTTWKNVFTLPAGQGFPTRNATYHFFDQNNGCILTTNANTTDRLHKTTNGGTSWTETSLPFHVLQYQFLSPNAGYVLAANGTDKYPMYRTRDGGLTWDTLRVVDKHNPTRFIYPSNLYFLNQNLGWVWGYSGILYKTTDGGNTWAMLYDFGGSPTGGANFKFRNEQEGWTIYNTSILETRDGGMSWKIVSQLHNYSGIYSWAVTDSAVYYTGLGAFSNQRSPLFKLSPGTDPTYAGPIAGDRTPCAGITTDYSVPAGYNRAYRWELSGGGTLRQFHNLVSVQWHTPGTYVLSAYPENNCGAGPLSRLEITVNDCPAGSITGLTVACAGSPGTYASRELVNVRYYWEAEGGVVEGSATGTQVTVQWRDVPTGKVKLTTTDVLTGCRKDTALVVTLPRNAARILLSDSTVALRQPIGTPVGTLSVAGGLPDGYGYALVPGAGSTDNDQFTIAGNQLLTAAAFAGPVRNPLSVRIRVSAPQQCAFEHVQQVYLEPDSLYAIGGTVTGEAGEAITAGKVILLRQRNNGFEAVASHVLAGTNRFGFNEVTAGTYTLRAEADTTVFTNTIPTYLGNVPTLAEATRIPTANGTTEYPIRVLSRQNPSGRIAMRGLLVQSQQETEGRIGQGTDETAGTPLSQVPVVLKAASDGKIKGSDVTDAGGKFSFNGLTAGSYYLLVDYQGIPMDSETYLVRLSEGAEVVEVTAVVGKTEIVVTTQAVTGVEPALQSRLALGPNPVAGNLGLRLENDYQGELTLVVSDLPGKPHVRKAYRKVGAAWHADVWLGDLPAGTYLLEIRFGHARIIRKIVKF